MANYTVTLRVSAAQVKSVEKKLRDVFGKDVSISVVKVTAPKSRAQRLEVAAAQIEDAHSIVTELKDEMEQWLESIPENLQNGTKFAEVEECKDALEEIESNLDSIVCGDVSFPGMF